MPARFATYPSLVDRPVFITGGGSGIGASLVEHFALQGARAAFVDVDEQASLGLVERLRGRCVHQPLFLACDITDTVALRSAIAQAAEVCGAARVLVNNAGSDDRHQFADVTPEY